MALPYFILASFIFPKAPSLYAISIKLRQKRNQKSSVEFLALKWLQRVLSPNCSVLDDASDVPSARSHACDVADKPDATEVQ